MASSKHQDNVSMFDGSQKVVVLILYVDNMLIICEDRSMINKLKKELSKSFDMKNLDSVQ